MAYPTGALVDDSLVHARLAQWAQTQPEQIAIDNGQAPLTFAALHQAVQSQAQWHHAQASPATVLVDSTQTTRDQLIQFFGILASGRCAAVADNDWPGSVMEAVAQSLPSSPCVAAPPAAHTPFYVGFTSGSTGLPKGFERDHRSWTESLRICIETFGPCATKRVLAAGRVSHSLFLFGMVLGLYSGGGVVVQEKFSATRMLQTLSSGLTPCVVAVPSQLLLLLELAQRKQLQPMPDVSLILISGARWMRQRTPELQALFPNARVVEFYGASETSFMAWMDADVNAPTDAVGHPFANVQLDIRGADPSSGIGQIYVKSPMLFRRYVGPQTDHTAAIRDGEWLSVRDMGYLNANGLLCLVGRENRMLVTQGKNLFPEEVETVLLTHPSLQHASVQGIADPLRGQQVVAVIHTEHALIVHELVDWCRSKLESYKVPKRFVICTDWPLTASGKTDHAQIQRLLQEHAPCLTPML